MRGDYHFQGGRRKYFTQHYDNLFSCLMSTRMTFLNRCIDTSQKGFGGFVPPPRWKRVRRQDCKWRRYAGALEYIVCHRTYTQSTPLPPLFFKTTCFGTRILLELRSQKSSAPPREYVSHTGSSVYESTKSRGTPQSLGGMCSESSLLGHLWQPISDV